MKTMEIVCGILHDEDGYLIARRGKGIHENIWEFPGGKVENGETKEEAILRELKEELNLTCQVEGYLTSIDDVREDVVLHVHAYRCKVICGEMKLRVHHEVCKVRLDEIYAYPFEKSDAPILEALRVYEGKSKES